MAEVYVDNDLSAYRGSPRPAYRRLLADIASGRIGAVVAWHLDRLHRHPRELEEFIDVAERARVALKTLHGDIDLSTSSGRLHARIMGSVARHESEHKSERLRRKHQQIASDGRPSGGGTRAFGYEVGGLVVREPEAELIRDAARRVLAGTSLRAIAREWDGHGIPTVSGRPWRPEGLKRILMSSRIAGLRSHHGSEFVAAWPAIISRDDHEALRALLDRPDRRGRPAAYLLTGLLRCGLCQRKMVAKRRSDGWPNYVCSSEPRHGGCGHITIAASGVDAYVWDCALEALDSPQFAQAVNEAAGGDSGTRGRLAQELVGYEERLVRLTFEYSVEGLHTKAAYLRLRTALETRIEDVRRSLADQVGRTALTALPTRDGDSWHNADLETRRAVLAAVVEKVVVYPAATRGGSRFKPDRIELRWRA